MRNFLPVFLACAVLFLLPLKGAVAGEQREGSRPTLSSASEVGYPPFCFVDEQGRADGFSVELFRAALAAMQRDVTFRIGPWVEVRSLLEQGKVAALPLVGRTPEREALFDFTFPYMTLHGAIVVRKGTWDIGDLADLKGKSVAVMKGDNTEEFLRQKERGISLQTTLTFEEALRLLSEGRFDAVVIQRLAALRLIQENDFANLKVIDKPIKGFSQEFCFAVKEGDRDTLALLNEGLALVMADGTYRHLHSKWFAALELPGRRRIVVGGDYNYPPYEYIDDAGRPAGYNVDITKAVAREMGLDIEIRLGPWSEIRRQLAQGEIDAIQGMLYSPGRDLDFDFSPPYIVNHYVGVVRKGERKPPESIERLKGLRIVVQKGDIMHDFAIENGLEGNLSLVDTQEDALRLLAGGKQDCALVSRISALYWIHENHWDDLLVGRQSFLSPGYCFAVPPKQQALLAQLAEGLKVLDESGEYRRIYEKWMGVYQDSSLTRYLQYLPLLLAVLLAVLLGVFLWSWSLRRQVARKTLQLSESAKKFRQVFESANVGKSMTLPTGEIHANRAFADFLGYSPRELRNKTWQELTPVSDLDAQRKELDENLKGKTDSLRTRKRYIRKDGSIVWADVSSTLMRGPDGEPQYFITTVVDVTEQMRAEAALKASEEQYRLLAENTLDAIWSMDMDFRFTYVNPAVQRLMGYTPEEWIGSRLQDHSDEENFSKMAQIVMGELEKRSPSSGVIFEADLIKKNGEPVPVEIHGRVLFDSGGRAVGLQGVTRDVSERVRAEQALRESEERYRGLLQVAPVGVAVLQGNRLVFSNPAGLEIIGASSPEQIIGKPIEEILHTDSLDQARARIRAMMSGDPSLYPAESRYVRLDGRVIDAEVMASPLLFNGKPALQVIITDVTEKKRAEKEQEDLQAQLAQAQKMESVGRLAGGVAHDYNNMLAVILGYAEMALEKIEPADPLHGDLEEILQAGQRSMKITRQLLAFARKQTVRPRVMQLNEALEGTLAMLRNLIGEDLELSWNRDPALWPVLMDPTQLDQVLANLCVNARDAMAGAGRIVIETQNTSFDDAFCLENPGFISGDYVLLAVRDNGTGMDAETLDNIFEPFFTTKEQGKGTGLGLSTVYGIVKQNNGFLKVESELGKGTSVNIYLPRYSIEKSPEPEPPAGAPSGVGHETILLVEDEHSILKMAHKMLTKLGYDVIAVPSPGEAIRWAREHDGAIHLLMTDVVMPEMNGRELARSLQAFYPGLKRLFMSGYTADIIAHHGVLEPGVHFIRKPFSGKELAAKVREALEA